MLCADIRADLYGGLVALGNGFALKDRGNEGGSEGVACADGVCDLHFGRFQK